MDFLTPEFVQTIQTLFDAVLQQEYVVVAFLTFFICEAIFATKLIDATRWKRLLAILFGGVVGVLYLQGTLLFNALEGMLVGSAVTWLVARFGNTSKA